MKKSKETVQAWVERRRAADLPNLVFIPPLQFVSSYDLIQRPNSCWPIIHRLRWNLYCWAVGAVCRMGLVRGISDRDPACHPGRIF